MTTATAFSSDSYVRRVRHAMRRSPEEIAAMPRSEYLAALRAFLGDISLMLGVLELSAGLK